MVNEFGCQKECANHLGVDKSTISRHVKALVKAGELEPNESDQGKRNDLHQRSGPKRATSERSCTTQPPVEKIPDHPPVQPVEDLLDEAQQRVKELEAELEHLRDSTRKLIAKRGAEAIKDADDAYTSAQSEFQQKPIDERIGAEAIVLSMSMTCMINAHKATFDEVADRFEAANATIHGPGSMDHQQWKTYRGFLEPFLDLFSFY